MRICIHGNYDCVFNLGLWLLKLRFAAVIVRCTQTLLVENRQGVVESSKRPKIIHFWLCMCVSTDGSQNEGDIWVFLCNC